MKETRIKETFGYKKRFHSPAFMRDKHSMLIGQLIKETMDKRNLESFLYPSLTKLLALLHPRSSCLLSRVHSSVKVTLRC